MSLAVWDSVNFCPLSIRVNLGITSERVSSSFKNQHVHLAFNNLKHLSVIYLNEAVWREEAVPQLLLKVQGSRLACSVKISVWGTTQTLSRTQTLMPVPSSMNEMNRKTIQRKVVSLFIFFKPKFLTFFL